MSYPRQDSVGRRLQKETLDALEATGAKGLNDLSRLWQAHRKELQLAIMNAYRAAAPRGQWNLGTFKSYALPQLQGSMRGILERFHALTSQTIKSSLNALYGQSVMRHAWILDQLTPVSRNVMIPHKKDLHEAAVTGIYYGAEPSKAWTDKWSLWVDSYNSALLHNLALGASNGGPVSDAVAEVDATTSNTPRSTLLDAMVRLYDYAATEAMGEGARTIGAMNENLVEEEVWRTRGDLRVCDDCDENEGLSINDAGFPPLHPNCHCFTEIVPVSFADLLRSGDAADRELARDMQRDGIVPSALVIRGDDGTIGAKAIVDFSEWVEGEGLAVTAR